MRCDKLLHNVLICHNKTHVNVILPAVNVVCLSINVLLVLLKSLVHNYTPRQIDSSVFRCS